MLFLFTIFKSLFSFFQTKLGMIILAIIIFIASFYFYGKHEYKLGFKDGIEKQKIIDENFYQKELKIENQKIEKKQTIINNQSNQEQKEQTKIITVYKTRILKIPEIIKEKNSIDLSQCKLTQNQLSDYNKLLDNVK
jgi:preprotein translocase subunit SecF